MSQEWAIGQAETAMARGAWSDAYAVLDEANAAAPLTDRTPCCCSPSPRTSPGTLTSLCRRTSGSTRGPCRGDVDAAAGAAAQIAFVLFDAVQYTPSRAWLRRAERLIEGRPDRPPARSRRCCAPSCPRSRATTTARSRLARESERLAAAAGDRDVAAISRDRRAPRADRARRRRGGPRDRSTKSSVAAVSGELGPVATGAVYCQANCTYQSVSDYERAEEWTRAMETWSASAGLTIIPGPVPDASRPAEAAARRLEGRGRRGATRQRGTGVRRARRSAAGRSRSSA